MNVKIAEDRYQNKMQFAHLRVSSAPNGTTTVPDGTGTGYTLGKLITFGSSYTTIVRAGERIATSAIINVVTLGEV
jgi:hypothetical protein